MAPTRTEEPVLGTFFLPVDFGEQDDPFQRDYLRPPSGVHQRMVSKSYPLVDVRQQVLASHHDGEGHLSRATKFMSEYGFTWVKHSSAIHNGHYTRVDLEESLDVLHEIYYPEVEALVKNVTGCKHVFITNSAIRGPKQSTLPLEQLNEITHANVSAAAKNTETPMHNAEVPKPTRSPHNDYTPLGARQAIRFWRTDMYQCASNAGIISAEDGICAEHNVDATREESDDAIAAAYNADGLGPRYAAFSIWRPWKTITRDPLAVTKHAEVKRGVHDDDTALWQYDIRAPGRDGDWSRRLEMLRAHRPATDNPEWSEEVGNFNWYYVSEQKPDEVLFLRLFDSASLGEDATEAKGSLHGSPDMGELAYGGPRESIEVRLLAIW